jgi:hypothetical protein
VIGASLVLGLFALCLGVLGGGSFHSPQDEQAFIFCVVGMIILIAGGVFSIAKLSRGIVRSTPEYQYLATPAPILAEASTQVPTPAIPDIVPSHPARVEESSLSSTSPPSFNVASHLSPASRAAIRNLVLAITGKLAAELVITLSGWMYTYRFRQAPFLPYRHTPIIWALATIAPLVVLLYALLRHPGPRAFAYSLVIPALHIFFGVFGHSATIFLLFYLRPGVPRYLSLLSLFPWLLDILILHLAWKAIRLTGIQPNSTRLIVAAAVMFFYTSFLPVILVVLNSVWH